MKYYGQIHIKPRRWGKTSFILINKKPDDIILVNNYNEVNRLNKLVKDGNIFTIDRFIHNSFGISRSQNITLWIDEALFYSNQEKLNEFLYCFEFKDIQIYTTLNKIFNMSVINLIREYKSNTAFNTVFKVRKEYKEEYNSILTNPKLEIVEYKGE